MMGPDFILQDGDMVMLYIWENLILAVKDYKWSLAMKVLICMVTAVLKCGMPLPEKSWLPFRVMDRTSADVWWLILIRKRRDAKFGHQNQRVSSIHVKGKCWQKEPPVINGEITGRIIWESGGAAL